ncbi:MFS transporter [Saccharopolyspora dendranthemae]|uniref:MFS transporter n=1 Tax=Saccharopolyspora dendranthemae TaxID=1181886 RepID=A0A561U4L7_9PSEU|nr:MFS transporter [Saccharopolyspora dendranthemae]TWF94309.1 MFS transporter [Saccharopolyspora dendranthemae]
MSTSTSLNDYRSALTTPGARTPVVTSLLGRLPIAMIGMALLLYVQRETSSFAIAGAVSAAELTGVAAGSVVQGRIVDRVGPSTPLYVASALFTAAVVATLTAIELGATTPLMVAGAFAMGVLQPNIASASRALWGNLLPPGRVREAAFSYEAISLEVFFILGPGLAGLLVATPWAGTGVVVGATCMVLGSVGFAATRAARTQRPEPGEHAGALLGAIAAPGMRTVALAALGFGVVIGFIEVAVPAAAVAAGEPTMGGLLMSLASVSSVVVGVLYGVHPWPRPMHLRLPALLVGFAGLVALLSLPTTLLGLALMLLLAGCLITPQSTAHSVAVEFAAPPGTAAEAFGWVVTSVTLGSAVGQSVSGQLVESSGPPVAFLVAGAAGATLAAALYLRRNTLTPDRATGALTLASN